MWPGIHTNTSRILTAFSDLPLEGDAVFPSGADILDYLHTFHPCRDWTPSPARPARSRRINTAARGHIAASVFWSRHVVLTRRRQRYVLPKFVAGVPSDHRMFSRYGALADEALPAVEIDRQLKEIVVESAGSPEQYGALVRPNRSLPPA